MGSLRQELWDAANHVVERDLFRHPPLARHSDDVAVVLGGSAATEDCDEYSGCDLFVFVPGRSEHSSLGQWQEVRRNGFHYRFLVDDVERFRAAVARGDDAALYLLTKGRVISDSAAILAEIWGGHPLSPELWTMKIAERYRALRQRRASLAWSLRRGQMIAVLDNLRLVLEHGLACCFYLEGQPAPPSKWLFRGALRTRAGRAVRVTVFELLSSLGDLAMLGGSMNLHHNLVYQRVNRFQTELEQQLVDAGYPIPGLARLSVGDALHGMEERTPRLRSRRRQA